MTDLELTASGTADFNNGDVYFIGNATTLIRFGGLTILTDPAFLHKGEHVYLGHGIWARREVEPACQIADLPPIDLIVLSHYHGDHFDDVAAQELDKKLPIVSTADAVDKLSALGFKQGYPLDTWESLVVRKGDATVNITAMPAKHATEEAVNELLMPVNGHLLDFSRNGDHLYRLYITGDTMLVDSLEDIPRRYPDIDLGLIHTGGHDLPCDRGHDDGRARSAGRRDHQTCYRHPDPLQRLLGIPVRTRRLQESRPGLDHEHEVRLPRSRRDLHVHAQRVSIAHRPEPWKQDHNELHREPEQTPLRRVNDGH
jgi:L-ascorbate metabolism protein UlaG (beta-lactamase superfamily)